MCDILREVILVVEAACDYKLVPEQLTNFAGKVNICLHEAFGGQGYQILSDIETILRNSKLKAPSVSQ